MSSFEKHYTVGNQTIVWKADLCQHSGICFRNLPEVFNPRVKPWIQPEHADAERVIATVRMCPSGALSMLEVQPEPPVEAPSAQTASAPPAQPATAEPPPVGIKIAANGPIRITGVVTITLPDGSEVTRMPPTALCRCGHSKAKPFCDGSHAREGFRDP